MEKMNFNVSINAPAEKIWKILWDDATYRQWTSAFSEGSHAVSDWKEGSKILFLGPGGEGGMYSMIAKIIPAKYMSFKHLGVVKDGKEQPLDDETKAWSGSMENYTLTENNGVTDLSVEIDVAGDFADYFKEAFPKALAIVKRLAEEQEPAKR